MHFLLVTSDLSAASLHQVLSEYRDYPVLQHFTSKELEQHLGIDKPKVVGFRKSSLSQSLYAELKEYRIYPGENGPKSKQDAAAKQGTRKA